MRGRLGTSPGSRGGLLDVVRSPPVGWPVDRFPGSALCDPGSVGSLSLSAPSRVGNPVMGMLSDPSRGEGGGCTRSTNPPSGRSGIRRPSPGLPSMNWPSGCRWTRVTPLISGGSRRRSTNCTGPRWVGNPLPTTACWPGGSPNAVSAASSSLTGSGIHTAPANPRSSIMDSTASV